jgi:hypothetical protein
MATPTLSPVSATSAAALTSTGSIVAAGNGAGNLVHYPFGIYADVNSVLYDANFINGASDQVTYTYKKLGGDILDIELTVGNIYTAYEEAVLEYSYIVNIHQGKNTLGQVLGAVTGTFDHDGLHKGDSPLTSTPNIALKFPKFTLGYVKQVGDAAATEVGLGGTLPIYSASIATTSSVQDYDLQAIIKSQATDSQKDFYDKVGDKRITVRKVFYKTPHAMWRFFGYYGGINAIGNLSTYGMYADDSTFEVIPPWQNKLQAMQYEDNIYTRNSHYSYEIKNNRLRIFPQIVVSSPSAIWVEFTVKEEPWEDSIANRQSGVDGINNMSTLPFANLPFENINSIGKQWIRRFALALTKEMLGLVRSKFATIPIPGESVTLNGSELLTQAKEEQEKLREELKTVLDEMTYTKLIAQDAEAMNQANDMLQKIPYGIYQG